ncbi:MAG: penicillin acylase family protein [Hyphomicrobiaceae bacterium]
MTRRVRKWLIAVAAVLIAVPVAALAGAWLIGRASVAPLSGKLELPGLSGPVDVVRDAEGVPHLFGRTLNDLYAALGFVHAQDRLWQMELLRRAGQGRLSEVFGERTIETDIFIRTLDAYGYAQRAVAKLTPEQRAPLEAYARGVNAFLHRPVGLLETRFAPEFLLLRHTPEPWTAADCLAILKMMALNLSTNFEHEITRLTYAAQGLSPDEIDDLMPPQDAKAPPLPDIRQLYALRPVPRQHAAATSDLTAEFISGGASNNWVVSGGRTKTGAPLLANDPHLRLGAPSTWYFAHLALQQENAPTLNVLGASLAGTPLIVLGRSDTLAWGFTNTGADVQDIFIERINPDNPQEYQTPDGWQRFTTDIIEIRSKNGPTRTLDRRRTRHGPVLPSSYRNLGTILSPSYAAALRWTALDDDDTTIVTGMFHPRMRTVGDYIEHMRPYVVPMQTMVVADTSGGIGMISPGRVPVRDGANAVMGRAPVPGWNATYDWKGFLKFEDLPRVENPPAGAFGSANASIVGPDYPHMITLDWELDYRAQRVNELILARSRHDMASMRDAQLDVLSQPFLQLKGLMIAAARKAGATDARTLDRLQAWDGMMRGDTAEPLMFMAWVRETIRAIYADDLGPAFPRFFNPQAAVLIRLLDGKAAGRDWCDNIATSERETCAALIATALGTALADLDKRYGSNRDGWIWGSAHYAANEHRPLGTLAVIGRFFNVEVPSPGGTYTLNRGQVDFNAEPPFANRGAASCRAIYDLSNLDNSQFIHTTGQSGNPFSPFYRSFAARWSKGEYIGIATKRPDIERTAIGTWQLTPK